MFSYLSTSSLVFYLVTYVIGVFLGYLIFYLSLDKKMEKQTRIIGIVILILGILMIISLFSSSDIPSIVHAMFLGALWGTCGIIGMIFYFLWKAIKKKKK